MIFSDKVKDAVEDYLQEELDCKVTTYEQDHGLLFECSGCFNPVGEDWLLNILVPETFEMLGSTIEDHSLTCVHGTLYNEWKNFNVDDDVRLWAESAGNGVTPGFKVLVENAEFKLDKLYRLWIQFYRTPIIKSLLLS